MDDYEYSFTTENDGLLEEKLKEFFEANFQYLKETNGHTIDSRMKEFAYRQVLCYWKKNRNLIEKATRSEVKLSLPEQQTPGKNYSYTLEGTIDVVRQNDKNCLFDITTRSIDQINGEINSFREQLNVYAHIWKGLDNRNTIDELGVISTSVPKNVREAMDSGNPEKIEKAFEEWEPVIDMEYSEDEIAEMINNFGEVVEKIQDCNFKAPDTEKLLTVVPGTNETYGNHICSNCDIRFSCDSYRKYKNQKSDEHIYSINEDLENETEEEN
ncbi:MAG: PD-(D/E)XK nuclease family protein [Treponema sp.]|nr:PD-(D/E)XK nuclease family protein [Treponema sp.]